jgi:hypothetical protein
VRVSEAQTKGRVGKEDQFAGQLTCCRWEGGEGVERELTGDGLRKDLCVKTRIVQHKMARKTDGNAKGPPTEMISSASKALSLSPPPSRRTTRGRMGEREQEAHPHTCASDFGGGRRSA